VQKRYPVPTRNVRTKNQRAALLQCQLLTPSFHALLTSRSPPAFRLCTLKRLHAGSPSLVPHQANGCERGSRNRASQSLLPFRSRPLVSTEIGVRSVYKTKVEWLLRRKKKPKCTRHLQELQTSEKLR